MNLNLIRTSVLALTVLATAAAYAQSTERKVSLQPHVLDAKSSVCAQRDVATGQSSGRCSSDDLMQSKRATAVVGAGATVTPRGGSTLAAGKVYQHTTSQGVECCAPCVEIASNGSCKTWGQCTGAKVCPPWTN